MNRGQGLRADWSPTVGHSVEFLRSLAIHLASSTMRNSGTISGLYVDTHLSPSPLVSFDLLVFKLTIYTQKDSEQDGSMR